MTAETAPKTAPDAEPVCSCMEVYEAEIVRAIKDGNLRTADEVREATGASGGCGTCLPEVEEILRRVNGTP